MKSLLPVTSTTTRSLSATVRVAAGFAFALNESAGIVAVRASVNTHALHFRLQLSQRAAAVTQSQCKQQQAMACTLRCATGCCRRSLAAQRRICAVRGLTGIFGTAALSTEQGPQLGVKLLVFLQMSRRQQSANASQVADNATM
jgi:hypothetical protein